LHFFQLEKRLKQPADPFRPNVDAPDAAFPLVVMVGLLIPIKLLQEYLDVVFPQDTEGVRWRFGECSAVEAEVGLVSTHR
jgi:hypothetical protein